MEIVRYEHKNVKWTLKHVNYYADALACGFLDAGLQPGDVVLSWLPGHFAEQVSPEAGIMKQNYAPNHYVVVPTLKYYIKLHEMMLCAHGSHRRELLPNTNSTFFNSHAPKQA